MGKLKLCYPGVWRIFPKHLHRKHIQRIMSTDKKTGDWRSFYQEEIMIDLKFLRENPEIVKQNIRNKFQDSKLPLVDEVIGLDAKARKTQQEADALRAERKKLSKQIGALMGQGKKEEAEAVKAQVNVGAERLAELEKMEGEQIGRAHV